MEDWGDSGSGGPIARLQAVHGHKRDERRFQLHVVLVFSTLVTVALGFQAFAAIEAKDVILTALPVFTYVLGKLDSKNE